MPHTPPGPIRCLKCRQLALPKQTRCLNCNARLPKARPEEATGDDAVWADPPAPREADGNCPGCGKAWSAGSVLCIECGYDLRTGRKRETVRGDTESEPDAPIHRRKRLSEPLPPGLGKVRLGLGFHYARLVLTLLAVLALMGLLCYAETVRPGPDDRVLLIGVLAAVGTLLLAALLGMVGSVLCLWVGRESRAWWFLFVSLVLDVATPPLIVYQQVAALPPVFGWAVEFVAWLFFMLFLRRLARYVDRPGEANEIMALITRGVALLVGVPLFLVLLAQIAFLSALYSSAAIPLFLGVSTLIIIVQLVFLVLLFFSILGNIQILRAAIARRLPRTREKQGRPPDAPS